MARCLQCGGDISDCICGGLNPVSLGVRPEAVRGTTHGDYRLMSQVIQEVKGAMRSGPQWGRCSAGQKEALELIATKIGRIVCGDPNFNDHWDDIIGYCNKVVETIPHKTYKIGS